MKKEKNSAELEVRRKKNLRQKSLAFAESENDYFPRIDRARFILIFFIFAAAFGSATGTVGAILEIVSGFAPCAYFILSGYLVMQSEARIKRAIKRTAITFVVLAVIYILLSAICAIKLYGYTPESFISDCLRIRPWVGLFAFNLWPFEIGGLIWYVQALLYAYIIILILKKLNLLKYDWVIALACYVFSLVVGEFSGLLRLNGIIQSLIGMPYISGNFLTRALPYVLLGGIMFKAQDRIDDLHPLISLSIGVSGVVLIVIEYIGLARVESLVYAGHLVGMTLVAFAVSANAIRKRYLEAGSEYFQNRFGRYYKIMYYIGNPVNYVTALIFAYLSQPLFAALCEVFGIITFVVSFIISFLVVVIMDLIHPSGRRVRAIAGGPERSGGSAKGEHHHSHGEHHHGEHSHGEHHHGEHSHGEHHHSSSGTNAPLTDEVSDVKSTPEEKSSDFGELGDFFADEENKK